MLKYYEIENYRSFKKKTRFSLERTDYKLLENTNTSCNILKGALFVGPNASGKSNALLPVKLLLDLLFADKIFNFHSDHCIFSMNPSMSLRYVFDINGSEIDYLIEYNINTKALRELLKVNNEIILDREGSHSYVSFTEKKEYADIQPDILFLREIYFNTGFRGNQILIDWFSFLTNSIFLDLFNHKRNTYLLKNFDLKQYLDSHGTDEINDFLKNYNFGQFIEYEKNSYGRTMTVFGEDKQIFVKREGINEPIPFYMESIGTQNLLQLLPAFFHVTKYNGILILDEFSSGFHNDLEKLLLQYFMKKSKNSQILFVTHSTNLLSNSILRPDQLYTVEFDSEGSKIKRFSDEKPRAAQSIEKMYLGGVFGGIPKFKD